MIIRCKSFARAGLLGNPSDGYFGKTISFSFDNFFCEVVIYESPEIRLVPGQEDDGNFSSVDQMLHEIDRFGYYGGIRVVKATIKVFCAFCREHGIHLPRRNFTLQYFANIPRLVGLSGSSAIATAVFKALIEFFEVRELIPAWLIPTLCWQAELQELNIQCGMQDRVIQVYDGLLYMDFEEEYFRAQHYGRYIRLNPGLLPRLYIAYDPARAEFSGTYHHHLRALFEQKNSNIVSAMHEFADIARQGYEAFRDNRPERLPALINANFDLRNRIFSVSPENKRMVDVARTTGASAKFAGSGGAIVGTYESDAMFAALSEALAGIGCLTIKPTLTPPSPFALPSNG